MAWYGSGRIVTDFLRVENRFGGLTGSQWTSTIAVLFAVGMLAAYAVRPERPAAVEPGIVEHDEPAPAG